MKQKGRYTSQILGVKVDCIKLTEVLKKVASWAEGQNKRYIVTPNPEMVVEAQTDTEFKRILNAADLSIPDGIGLVMSSRAIKERVAGAEVMMEMCRMASQNGYKVFLLGGLGEVANKAAEELEKQFEGLKIKAEAGPQSLDKATKQENERVVKMINDYKPKFLFVGFGHNKQEKWIDKNIEKLKIKVAMGVGGSFDYLVKPMLRAPKMIQGVGLEWLWRLALQPWRIKRQFRLVRFVWLRLKQG